MANGVVSKLLIVIAGTACGLATAEVMHAAGVTELIWALDGHDSIAPVVWVLLIWPTLIVGFVMLFHKLMRRRTK